MRLAIAFSLLAHSLPTAKSKSRITSTVTSSNLSGQFAKDVLKTLKGKGKERDKYLQELEKFRLQSNNHGSQFNDAEKNALRECDPESKHADVGVLSCGVGRYCVQSSDSYKGGYCVSSPDELARSLQSEPIMSLLDGILGTFCNASSPYFAICNCTEFDENAYTVDVNCFDERECTPYKSLCDQNTTSCINYEIFFTVTAPQTYSVTRCFNDVLPYDQKTCYTFDVAPGASECAISVDEEDCFKCEVQADSRGIRCFNFDCTNTVSRSAGSQCDGANYVSPILYYLNTYGCDAYKCPICGEDFVSTNPDGAIDLGEGKTSCAAVHQVSQLGGFNSTFCQDVVIPAVAGPCGCVMAGSPPVEVPSDTPVAAPVAQTPPDQGPAGAATVAPSATATLRPQIAPVVVTFPPVSPPPTSPSTSLTLRDSGTIAIFVGFSLMAFLEFM